MKKREKPPEVAAFEQAFDRGEPGGSDGGTGSPWPAPGQSAIRRSMTTPPGQRSQAQPLASRPLSQSLPSVSARPSSPLASARSSTGALPKQQATATPPADRVATLLVRVVLVLVALYGAYSLQSHSQRQYALGPVSDGIISEVAYTAGWPLTYAQVDVQQVPSSNFNPPPPLQAILPLALLADILVVGVPLWLLLEAIWLLWGLMLRHFGPKRMVRRLVVLGLTGLLATLWLVAGLALGGYLSLVKTPHATPSTWPKYAWLVIAPAVPGFTLASALSSVLGIPANLWSQDVGVFLLVMGLPILLLTAIIYIFCCLIGRGLRRGRDGH